MKTAYLIVPIVNLGLVLMFFHFESAYMIEIKNLFYYIQISLH